MKLTTNNGELDLPVDFSFEVELNNPFFSDEGDSTIPATIPATPNNLKILDNIHRVDRANRFMKTTPATLMAGVIQKHGQLIIDTLSMKDGIAVSLAIENSDVYSQYKSKSLKEIFASKIRDDWNRNIEDLVNYLLQIYFSRKIDDFTIFPVAVSPYEENEEKIYQYNNERAGNSLLWQARIVKEGDLNMSVTDGYGLSPFLYLYKMIDLLFQQLGFTVSYNCLAQDPYQDIVVLNNCSDTIVKGIIKYSDLVPSCTLSEFLDFLRNKFGIHCRIDSNTKTAQILMLQDILSSSPDFDITDKVVDDLDVIIEDTSRVILSSDTSIDGTTPAAETLDKLIEQYGYYIEITEEQYVNLLNNIPIGISDCLIMRQETGQFYELRRVLGSDTIIPTFVGTNYFTYDRNNSSNQESLSSPDVMPAIIYNRTPFLYIGNRLHYNTSYNNSQESSEQSIMIAWKTLVTAGSIHLTFGTTQKYFAGRQIKDFSLTTYDMYDFFWSNYNNLLLNGKITLKGTILYDYLDILSIDITKPKSYRGQNLLPLKTTFEISEKLKNHDSEFILIKNFLNSEKDVKILPETKQKFNWEIEITNSDDSAVSNLTSRYPKYYDGRGWLVGSGSDFDFKSYNWDMYNDPEWPMDMMTLINYAVHYNGYNITILSTDETIYLGVPKNIGEKSSPFEIDGIIKAKQIVYHVDYTGSLGAIATDFNPTPEKITAKIDINYKSVTV